MRTMKRRNIRHAVEVTLTALLFSLQYILVAGPFISIMFAPLFVYLISLPVFYPHLEREIDLLFFSKDFIFGRVIVVIGLAIFLLAGFQFLRKQEKLVVAGVYSVVRHPQYLGIVVITLGLSIMCLQLASQPQILLMWIVQVFGYILLARYEEWHLVKEHKAEYQQYKQKVPFIFPVSSPPKIPETLFTLLLVLVIAFLCLAIHPT